MYAALSRNPDFGGRGEARSPTWAAAPRARAWHRSVHRLPCPHVRRVRSNDHALQPRSRTAICPSLRSRSDSFRPGLHPDPARPANPTHGRTPAYPVSVSASRLRRVAVLVLEGAKPLDVGIPAQVFTTRASMPYEVRLCGAAPGLVTGGDGLSYHVADGLDALAWADIVFIPGYRFPDRDDPPQAVVDALIAAHDRGARLAAISTGAFALAATGLLDGRRATTHWHYTRALVARHPLVEVDENVLFVDEGSVLTSAGAASGIDLCLHILRGDLGVAASNHAARRLVAAPTAVAVRRSMCPAACLSRSVSDSPTPASGRCTGSTSPHPRGTGAAGGGLAAHVLAALRSGDRVHADAVGHAGPHRHGPRAARAFAAQR